MFKSINPELIISPEILKLVSSLDEFNGEWRAFKRLSRERLFELKKIATIESVGSSTRIEGAKLSDSQVATLLSGLNLQSYSSRDEQEVAGYAAAMDLIFESFEHIPITENHIRQMHRVLLQFSDKDERHRGNYKSLENHVAAFDEQGNQIGIIFETESPFDAPFAMKHLIEWFAKVEADNILHPLLRTGVFIVWFLAIHPFQDGNGRLSRVLTTLFLLRSGYSYIPYSSLEAVIEENKELYYKALRTTQLSIGKESQDWETWLLFFLRCLVRQKENLRFKIKSEQKHLEEKSPVLALILRFFDENDYLTIAQIIKLTGVNRNTLKVKISDLTDAGILIRHGKGRGVYYTRAK